MTKCIMDEDLIDACYQGGKRPWKKGMDGICATKRKAGKLRLIPQYCIGPNVTLISNNKKIMSLPPTHPYLHNQISLLKRKVYRVSLGF